MTNKYETQLKILRQGCRKKIYAGSFDGEEPYDIGWKCGDNADGIILYCNPCWRLMKKVEGKKNKLEKELGE